MKFDYYVNEGSDLRQGSGDFDFMVDASRKTHNLEIIFGGLWGKGLVLNLLGRAA